MNIFQIDYFDRSEELCFEKGAQKERSLFLILIHYQGISCGHGIQGTELKGLGKQCSTYFGNLLTLVLYTQFFCVKRNP